MQEALPISSGGVRTHEMMNLIGRLYGSSGAWVLQYVRLIARLVHECLSPTSRVGLSPIYVIVCSLSRYVILGDINSATHLGNMAFYQNSKLSQQS